jgi:hypothetical protein
MSAENDDLIGGEVNPLGGELQAARSKIAELINLHRHYTELFARIARAAGVHINGSLEGIVDAVIVRLADAELTAPLPEVPGSGLTCEICGNDGAADLGDAVLCPVCSGEVALAEEGRRHG